MTVSELIKSLKSLPQDARVCWINTDSGAFVEVESAYVETDRFENSEGAQSGTFVCIGDRRITSAASAVS